MRNSTRYLFTALLLIAFSSANGQGIGVNNPTPAPSAILDLTSNSKGFLVPRMTSIQRLSIAAPATGLLVYETTTSQFFYFDGTAWRSLVGDNRGWLLLGNAGTNPTTNFIGTTDNVPLMLRVNNQPAGKIDQLTRNVVLGHRAGAAMSPASTSNTILGDSAGVVMSGAGQNVVVGARAVSAGAGGTANVVVGVNAGRGITTGSNNVYIGSNVGPLFQTGSSNTIIGSGGGPTNNIGNFNTYLGEETGSQAFGSGNTFIGARTGRTLMSGSKNTALGDSANIGFIVLSNATAIGANATVNADNSMVLGSVKGENGANFTVNVGIGNTIPFTRLDVAGDLALREVNDTVTAAVVPFLFQNEASFIRLTSTVGAFELAGMAFTANGKIVTLFNSSGADMTILEQSTICLAPVNRFMTGAGNLIVSNRGSVTLQYSQTVSRWIVIGHSNATFAGDTKPNIFSVAGTTTANAGPSAALMPEMTITFTPQDSIALVQFSAAGSNVNTCGQRALHFILRRNGVVITTTQTSIEDVTNFSSNKIWDVSLTHPVVVTPGVSTTIDIQWLSVGTSCGTISNGPATSSFPNGSYRTLTVIESGGNGSFTASGPPQPATNSWNLNGNTGTNAATNFLGTTDNMPVAFRVFNQHAGILDHLNHNAAFGFKAGGIGIPTGDFNVFIGDSAGFSSGSASNNTFTGNRSGRSTTGTLNSFFGAGAGRNNTSGSFNAFFGAEAGSGNGTGTENTYLGNQAGLNNANTSSNTMIGSSAGASSSGGSHVFIGKNAGQLVQGSNNICIGFQSGVGGGSGTGNIFIGSNTGDPSLVATNAAAIGFNATVSVSNAMVLGGIAGTNGASVTTNVGIGTSAPSRRLHVVNAGSSGAVPNANAGFVLESNNNHFAHFLTPDANETGLLFGRPSSSTNAGIIYNNSLAFEGMLFRTGGNVNRMTITSAGNIGIGTTNPTERLMVMGNIDASDDLYTGATNGIINCGGGNMNAGINIIADLTPTPLNANGDEDLYIADALELGGQGFKPGGGSWAAASDVRLKQDIKPFTDGLDKVLAIRPVSFKYNNHFKTLHDGKTYIGVIAQEIKEVAPYTVELTQFGQINMEDENGNERIVKEGEAFYSYDSSALTYMLINAIKELKQLNDDQQQQISELTRQLEQLRQSK